MRFNGQAISAFIRLGRPHFLAGGFVLYGLGVAIARYEGIGLDLTTLLWGQVAVTSIQWMTHYANDYFDLDADRVNPNRTLWAGGSGVLPAQLLPAWVALATAVLLAVIAVGVGLMLALVLLSGHLTLPLILLSLLLAWSYSAPPLRLHSTGVGEVSTAFLVPVMTPQVGYYLQTGALGLLPLLATIPLAAFQFAMLLVIEFPDAEGDRLSGKRTLVVRLGADSAVRLHNWVLLSAYVVLPLLVVAGLPPIVLLAFVPCFPLAGWQIWRMTRGQALQRSRWNSLAFTSIVLLTGTAALELLAFAVSA